MWFEPKKQNPLDLIQESVDVVSIFQQTVENLQDVNERITVVEIGLEGEIDQLTASRNAILKRKEQNDNVIASIRKIIG